MEAPPGDVRRGGGRRPVGPRARPSSVLRVIPTPQLRAHLNEQLVTRTILGNVAAHAVRHWAEPPPHLDLDDPAHAPHVERAVAMQAEDVVRGAEAAAAYTRARDEMEARLRDRLMATLAPGVPRAAPPGRHAPPPITLPVAVQNVIAEYLPANDTTTGSGKPKGPRPPPHPGGLTDPGSLRIMADTHATNAARSRELAARWRADGRNPLAIQWLDGDAAEHDVAKAEYDNRLAWAQLDRVGPALRAAAALAPGRVGPPIALPADILRKVVEYLPADDDVTGSGGPPSTLSGGVRNWNLPNTDTPALRQEVANERAAIVRLRQRAAGERDYFDRHYPTPAHRADIAKDTLFHMSGNATLARAYEIEERIKEIETELTKRRSTVLAALGPLPPDVVRHVVTSHGLLADTTGHPETAREKAERLHGYGGGGATGLSGGVRPDWIPTTSTPDLTRRLATLYQVVVDAHAAANAAHALVAPGAAPANAMLHQTVREYLTHAFETEETITDIQTELRKRRSTVLAALAPLPADVAQHVVRTHGLLADTSGHPETPAEKASRMYGYGRGVATGKTGGVRPAWLVEGATPWLVAQARSARGMAAEMKVHGAALEAAEAAAAGQPPHPNAHTWATSREMYTHAYTAEEHAKEIEAEVAKRRAAVLAPLRGLPADVAQHIVRTHGLLADTSGHPETPGEKAARLHGGGGGASRKRGRPWGA